MKKNNKKFHRGGVLLLALILAVNMLMPASAWAGPFVPEVGKEITADITIDGVEMTVNYADGDTVKWHESYGFTVDSDSYVVYNGCHLTLDGTNLVLATDEPEAGGAYTTVPIPQDTGEKRTIPMYLTVEAAPLEFTVTENIQMSGIQGASDLTIDPVTVTNIGSENLKLSQVEITAASGWSVANASTDFTTADSKNKIAFTAGSHDFANGAYTPGEKIAAGTNTTLQLAGKISEKADLTNATQVASMVLTVEKDVTLISFYIRDTSYQAERGMTWAEWVNSSYNISGLVLYYNNIVTKSYDSIVSTANDSYYAVLGTDIINADLHYYLCANSG